MIYPLDNPGIRPYNITQVRYPPLYEYRDIKSCDFRVCRPEIHYSSTKASVYRRVHPATNQTWERITVFEHNNQSKTNHKVFCSKNLENFNVSALKIAVLEILLRTKKICTTKIK